MPPPVLPFQDLATAMDDGTAGEMVASCNYWKAMSTITTNKSDSDGSSEPPTLNPETSGGTTSSSVEKKDGGDGNGGDGDFSSGGGSGGDDGGASFGTSSILGGVEWASNHLESGNMKVDTSVSAAEASFVLSEGNTLHSFLNIRGLRVSPTLTGQLEGLGTGQRSFAPLAKHRNMFGE